MIPLPTYEQLDGGNWIWYVAGANGEKFVGCHEPDGFATIEGARKNFALAKKYFTVLHYNDEAERIMTEISPIMDRPAEEE